MENNQSCPVSDSSSMQLEKTTCPESGSSAQPVKTTAPPSNTEQIISEAKVGDSAPSKEEHVIPVDNNLVESAKPGEEVKEVVDEPVKVEGGAN
ncbi:hypothetical protein QQ045_021656 [Rhodiola kirilowii]